MLHIISTDWFWWCHRLLILKVSFLGVQQNLLSPAKPTNIQWMNLRQSESHPNSCFVIFLEPHNKWPRPWKQSVPVNLLSVGAVGCRPQTDNNMATVDVNTVIVLLWIDGSLMSLPQNHSPLSLMCRPLNAREVHARTWQYTLVQVDQRLQTALRHGYSAPVCGTVCYTSPTLKLLWNTHLLELMVCGYESAVELKEFCSRRDSHSLVRPLTVCVVLALSDAQV